MIGSEEKTVIRGILFETAPRPTAACAERDSSTLTILATSSSEPVATPSKSWARLLLRVRRMAFMPGNAIVAASASRLLPSASASLRARDCNSAAALPGHVQSLGWGPN